jgi:hypothetical protein
MAFRRGGRKLFLSGDHDNILRRTKRNEKWPVRPLLYGQPDLHNIESIEFLVYSKSSDVFF